ncbi:hypothetical protein G6F43_014365 [Rhizopus delemar]|nr:hypothetical protein G6F43_014365 [Rhizopus delemar]
MGPFLVVNKNKETNIYKLVSVGGEPYNSWVHVDRLKEVKAEEIKEPWYNPTVSRAAWRAEMGLSSGAAGGSGVVSSSGVANVAVDRGRSQSLGGNDVVPKVRRFKPTVLSGSLKHCMDRRSKTGPSLKINLCKQ